MFVDLYQLLPYDCNPYVSAGGISSLDDAEKFLSLGADRLGTSRIIKIVKNEEATGY